MVAFLRMHQTDIMYVLSGICGMITVFACITKYPSKKRKLAQLMMALSTVVLLISEILGEKYSGDTTLMGYWMVRVCNFLIYLITLLVVHFFNLYLSDLIRVDLRLPVPKRLQVVTYLTLIGVLLIAITPVTGLYYTFDSMNQYHRSPFYLISYLFPLITIIILFMVILEIRKKIQTNMWITLMLFPLMPLVAASIQLFLSDLYITDMAIVVMVVLLYVFTVLNTNRRLVEAQTREIQILKGEQEHAQRLFAETVVALADAIDAKDSYTHGHSSRVAHYSRRIAAMAGKSEEECSEVYYAALLHDVGKIGIPDSVINKEGALTSEEYEMIKTHTTIGYTILSEISDSPNLRIVARNHHERFDGTGYPDGLKGRDIPELARIVSVADAYDAMTSNRSYRKPLAQERVRNEIARCSGTQFDPDFAQIMLDLIKQDPDFTMRERR